jgi:hypothetical protein
LECPLPLIAQSVAAFKVRSCLIDGEAIAFELLLVLRRGNAASQRL